MEGAAGLNSPRAGADVSGVSLRTPIPVRGPATLALALLLGFGLAAPASAAERYGVAVLPPHAAPLLAPLAPGLREWLSGRLAAAGVGVLPSADVDRDAVPSGYDGGIRREQVPALADVLGAAMVLALDLRFETGRVDLRLRLHDGPTGDVLTGAVETGRVAELGAVAQRALAHLLEQLGFDAAALRAEEAARIVDLSALGRARAQLDADRVMEAWQELASARGPAVESARAEIEGRVAAPEATPMLRSRFANATGQPDRSWLRVRGALRNAEDPEVLLAAGDAARARSDAEAAARFYERALALDPESFEAQLGRAESLIEDGRSEEGREALEAAIRLAPADPRPLRVLAAQEDAAPEDRARHWLRVGDLHASRLEPDPARAAYDAAARVDPSVVARAHGKAARLDERIGNDDQALLSYEQAYELGLHDPALLAGLGRSRRAALDVEGAEQAFRRLVTAEPENLEGQRGLGDLLGSQRRHQEALPHLEKAVSIAPGDVATRRALARVSTLR